MPWLQPFADPTLAELAARSNISSGGGISSGLLRTPPNQWLEALNQVAPVIKDYIQKKKSDEIANQLMNMQQPPRAEAVDYPQGIPATEPFMGGVDQMQVNQAYQAYLAKQREDEQKSRLTEARIADLKEQPSSRRNGVARYPVKLPDGSTIEVTGNEALEHYNRAAKAPKRSKTDDEWLLNRAIARGKLDESGEFTNDYSEAATGDWVKVLTPKGETLVVPWSEYERRTKQAPPSQDLPAMAEPQAETRYDSPPTIQTKEERDALPSGTVYIGPDGKKHRKP